MSGNAGKNAAAVSLTAALVVLYYVAGIPELMGRSVAASCLLHHFFHVNLLHLATNCYAVLVLYRRRFSLLEFAVTYIIGSLVWLVSPVQSVGYSNILFATMGLRTPSFASGWWRSPSTVIFLCVMFAYLLVPGVSAVTHIAAFALGVAAACIGRFFNSTVIDYGKAKGSGK